MSKRKFVPPTDKSKLSAIGLLEISPGNYEWDTSKKGGPPPPPLPPLKYFIPERESFPDVPKPKRGDWLSEHNEPGQAFHRFVTGPRMHPLPRKDVVYMQPLEFNAGEDIEQHTLSLLCEYARSFFDLPVKLLKPLRDFDGRGAMKSIDRRLNEGERQVNASDCLDFLKSIRPKDAFCIAGVTLCDLYPKDEWNFVFGYASMDDSAGVYSMARYLPETAERPLLLRAVRVMCHEVCHMFGIKHCIHFSCLMNGSNHANEAVNRPSFLCPVCLRKLQYCAKFDVETRYEKLLVFWEKCTVSNGSNEKCEVSNGSNEKCEVSNVSGEYLTCDGEASACSSATVSSDSTSCEEEINSTTTTRPTIFDEQVEWLKRRLLLKDDDG